MTESERRRRRPTVSCSVCRRRKIRCNRETPCSNCVQSKNAVCIFDGHPPLSRRQRLDHGQTSEASPAQESSEFAASVSAERASTISRRPNVLSHASKSLGASSTSASTPGTQASTHDTESMQTRIQQLEQQLSEANEKFTHSLLSSWNPRIETTTSGLSGTFHHESRLFGRAQVTTRSVIHKTRLFGQSHWFNGAAQFLDILQIIEPYVRDETSKAFSGIQRCKSLARVIKSQRAPLWPCPPTAALPVKVVTDVLVDCYLRTSETIYRILHVPTFRRDYETLWASETKPSEAFLVQLKLVLAIGAVTYDEVFSLRDSAMQWVYEAQSWLSEPEFKSRLTIQSLQTNLLLLLARELVGVGRDLVWISAGAVLRSAVYMGLHRDPTHLPRKSAFAAEMRRRLWNTVLEISLQSSMTSGGPPLLSLDDFDTEPPGNYDDDQLTAEDPAPKLEDACTQVSAAIALRKTFPLRLAIAKFLNNLASSGTYEETLRLDAELRTAYKTLRQSLHRYRSSSGASISDFEVRVIDFLMHRYLSSLHIPFFGPSLHEAAYAFSRKVAVETSLKLWAVVCPVSSSPVAPFRGDAAAAVGERDDLARLAVCGSGYFRIVAVQASFVIAGELRSQLREEEGSLGPVPLRSDLLAVLAEAKEWNLRCIEAGETSVKGYLFMALVSAQIDGLMRGIGKEEFPELLVRAAEEAEERCLPVLEAMFARGQPEVAADALDQLSLNAPPEPMDDWDFMMSDAVFNFGNTEPKSWGFGDDTTQQPSLW